MPTGVTSSERMPGGLKSIEPCTVWLARPIRLTLAPSSLLTHSWLAVSRKRRGRLPTAMFFTTLRLATSITWTMLATSEATYTVLLSALTLTPSGSPPTLTSNSFLRARRSKAVTVESSSFDA